jgi:hypothetical protein
LRNIRIHRDLGRADRSIGRGEVAGKLDLNGVNLLQSLVVGISCVIGIMDAGDAKNLNTMPHMVENEQGVADHEIQIGQT